MPIVKSDFKPAWWLHNPHLQTLWSTFFKQRPELDLNSDRLELVDGDFIDISSTKDIQQKPIVLILHGLEGTLESHYAKPLIKLLDENGYGVCFMHFRGCSGEINRLKRSYHSGDSADLQTVIEHIKTKYQQIPFAIIGFSLGGNVLLKWLGEQKQNASTTTAVAVSVPFKLRDAADRLEKSFSRVYQKHLINSCQTKYKQKDAKFNLDLVKDIESVKTFFEFDDKITAPLHGFKDADDYYTQSSSHQYLSAIEKPTLILHAEDDPFMWKSSPPTADEISVNISFELSKSGGHVGFISGKYPWAANYWADERILKWLSSNFN
ncbi:hydrolase [uncultured Cocleimonas sp.]|uniref:hydrolase n=1 Tax=uncultured Cocleimonas sp. TaxID=1051587 RepID=UPI0026134CDE|nr:hydrolase [uncultured Cocleimonas sp.]